MAGHAKPFQPPLSRLDVPMKPRLVRLKSPKGTGEKPVYNALAIMRDRFVVYLYGNDLHVLDLRNDKPIEPVFVVEDGQNFTSNDDILVIYDEVHHFRRFEIAGDRFVQTAQFALPEQPHPWPTSMTLSPSGRFLVIEVPGLPEEKSLRVVLMDASSGRVLATYPYLISARASFVRLGDKERLFLSAADYMSIMFIDPESGKILHSFESQNSWDFCHTDYELSADGSRLLVFGCVWAAPYEARLYDATPWTRNGSPSKEEFPLPMVYRQYEDLEYEIVYVPHFTKNAQGWIDVNGSVSLHELRKLNPEQLHELRDGLSGTNLAILDAALGLEGKSALLQRRVDPVSGQVREFSLVPVQAMQEMHVHALPNHQVLIVEAAIQWFDGEKLHEVGTLESPKSYYCSAVTSDGSVVVVRELAD